ncbi:S-layer homology domain-containing protein [Oscillibacter sp.]|uniref:S-layer homology domain-containing protein n=1 Tax=Oscillibacter sp. TaxID=1945593 RepID=UPI00289CB642|nr:S-layer homology domain-containing protein [Oscillibacter sp.]
MRDAVTTLSSNSNSISVDGLAGAAGSVADSKSPSADAAADALNAALSSQVSAADVKIYVQPYLDISVTDAKINNNSTTELTLEIKPMVKTVASTATSADSINLTDTGTKNAVQIGTAATLEVNTPVIIKIAIPSSMATVTEGALGTYNPLTIKHVKENGTIYYYEADVTKENGAYYAEFTVTNGFSEFRLMAADTRAATVTYSTTGSAVIDSPISYSITNVGDALPSSSKSGYTFNGWFFDGLTGTYTTLPDLWSTTASMGDISATASAQFTQNFSSGGGSSVSSYTLTFDTNGGSALSKVSKTSGVTVDLANYVPSRHGYTFSGWYADSTSTKAITSVKMMANTTVYAKWTENTVVFTDVNTDAYYYDAVLWAVDKGVTTGTTSTTFSPNGTCTRGQTVTFLWRAMGSPEPDITVKPFTDVAADAYYYKAVLWAVEQGITQGTSDTTFSPDAVVSRGQTVMFLWRAAGMPASEIPNPFADVAKDAYYYKAVLWATEKSITSGTSNTSFEPDGGCNRAQIVTFLYRYPER